MPILNYQVNRTTCTALLRPTALSINSCNLQPQKHCEGKKHTRTANHNMNFVERLRNAIGPDAAANGGEPVTSGAQPETDIPGAFPDSDDEQEVEKRTQKNLAQGVSDATKRERDASGNDVGESHDVAVGNAGSPGPTAAGELPDRFQQNAPSSNNESIAESKGAEEAARAEAAAIAARIPSGGEQERPGFAMDDKETKTMSVRTPHLSNEGTAPPPPCSPTTGEVKEEQLGQANESMARVPAQAAPSSPAVDADSMSESLGQYSGAGSAGLDKIPSNGGIRNGVLGRGDSHLGTHLGIARLPRPEEEDRSPAAAQAGEIQSSTGVPYGENAESPKERRRSSSGASGSKKARAQAVHLSGVSEAGLGLGGVHNGVVGHGSHDDESTRHSMSSERAQPASTTA